MLEDLFDVLSSDDRTLVSELFKFTIDNNLKCNRSKTKDIIYVFSHPKTKERIMKFSHGKKQGFMVSLRFHLSKSYSTFFSEAIRKSIEEYDYRYTGCYPRCNKCDGTKGYIYTYPDGRQFFRCYLELINLPNVSFRELDELKALIITQITQP